jgi:geranyl-CoA carboxylase beta subunit
VARELIDQLNGTPCRRPQRARTAVRRARNCWAWCPPTSASPTTCARSSRASSTARTSSSSRPSLATDTVCGHARLHGQRVGILGNNGPIQPAGSTKAAQFIQLCDQSGTPLVFLQNTTGYMVGKAAEQAGAIKHGSKMIQAVANARVPKFTIVLGGSFGAGNYGMCGRGFDPRFIFSWPSARTAVMGGAQAAKVMDIVNRNKLQKMGLPANDEALAAMSDALRRRLDAESQALFGTARLWDDGIIDPRDTRRILGLCLALWREAEARTLRPNTFGVARF